MNKRVVVSCGPIPAKLDSVKFITNRFKGGLAFETVRYLMNVPDFSVTMVTWKMTEIPEDLKEVLALDMDILRSHTVEDVYDYYNWMESQASNYDAFVMAAAVANLTPVHPYEGKFPSHNYNPGDEFFIKFTIAPRAIDIIKKVNPRACLVGYKLFDAPNDEDLVRIARHTLDDSKANVIFANTPKDAKNRKLALTQDGSVIPMTYTEHNEFIERAIRQEYFRTEIQPLTEEEASNVDFQYAKAIVKMFEETFPDYGTVAVPVPGEDQIFATTARGHKGEPVFIRNVDGDTRTVYATGKTTLNAPALALMMDAKEHEKVIVHRHAERPEWAVDYKVGIIDRYVFPGTKEEYDEVKTICGDLKPYIEFKYHGYLAARPIRGIDWNQYYDQFPVRYFKTNPEFDQIIKQFEEKETLELGGNVTATAKYSYDPYVPSPHCINVKYDEIMEKRFDLGYAKNAINYLGKAALAGILSRCDHFIANTFHVPPAEKVTAEEAAVRSQKTDTIYHALRLYDDSIVSHAFYAYTQKDYEELGLTVVPYGKNSAYVLKNLEIPLKGE